MIKRTLARLLARPIKLYNKIKIKSHYNSLDIKAEEIKNLGKTLILVPHVDDEIIGLGGLLAGLSGELEFHLLYGTDSGASKSDKSREEISKERFLEAEHISKDLGIKIVKKIVNLCNEDTNWSFKIFKDHLTEVFENNNYDSIFTVSMIDSHREHQQLTYFLADFLKEAEFKGNIYLYEVSNLFPNHWINTYYKMSPSDWQKKKALYNNFQSQTTMDFDIFNKLNEFKSLSMNMSEPVEFFVKMEKNDFVERVEKIRVEDLSKIIPFRIGNNSSFYKVINREKTTQDIYKNKGW